MYLITMAHMGEAQGIIENFNLKKISPQLFEGEVFCLLLTGEGPFEAATATAQVLGIRSFHKVINLGIAGSLCSEFQTGQIYPIRTLYLVVDGKPQFKSFQACVSGVDGVTSFERVLRPEKALPLKGLGKIVDREAWGVAFAAKNQGLSFECFKLISDIAGTPEACKVVQDDRTVWSQKLSEFLLGHLSAPKQKKAEDTHLPGFHFTFTTDARFRDLMQKISIKEEKDKDAIFTSLPVEQLRNEKLVPKERTKKLLTHLEERIDPVKKILQTKIEAWKRPLDDAGISVQIDPQWETSVVKINLTAESDKELKEKLRVLQDFSLTPYQELLQGKIDVE